MKTVRSSFTVQAPIQFVLDTANKVEDWPSLNPSCTQTRVLNRQGYRTLFEFSSAEGLSWVSAQYSSSQAPFSFSERIHPPRPFSSFQLLRSYRELGPDTTEVTECVSWELSDDAGMSEDSAAEAVLRHAALIQPVLKERIEEKFRKSSAS